MRVGRSEISRVSSGGGGGGGGRGRVFDGRGRLAGESEDVDADVVDGDDDGHPHFLAALFYAFLSRALLAAAKAEKPIAVEISRTVNHQIPTEPDGGDEKPDFYR